MADMATIKGTVKWFNLHKGYGYITGEDGKEYFVHFSGIENGRHYNGFEEGDQVEFGIESTQKGGKAVHVKMTAAVKKGKKEPNKSDSDAAENSEPVE